MAAVCINSAREIWTNSRPYFPLAGKLDLVVGNGDGTLVYYKNTGTSAAPEFEKQTGEASPFDETCSRRGVDVGRYSAPALADFDGDGDLDLWTGETEGSLVYYANGHCTTSCNNRGVCDDSATVWPSCDCLTGFMGDQCDDCQAGYFGSTCELCPEGGGETKAAPRITDTCGVAGSGRSRGACDDGFVGSGNCTCFSNFAGDDCSEGSCPAGTVESVKQNGVFYEAFCEPCPPGTYQGVVGDVPTCIKCPAPSTTVSAGQTGCYTCSADS